MVSSPRPLSELGPVRDSRLKSQHWKLSTVFYIPYQISSLPANIVSFLHMTNLILSVSAASAFVPNKHVNSVPLPLYKASYSMLFYRLVMEYLI